MWAFETRPGADTETPSMELYRCGTNPIIVDLPPCDSFDAHRCWLSSLGAQFSSFAVLLLPYHEIHAKYGGWVRVR